TVALTAPAQNAKVGRTVQVSASASDAVGVTKVEFYADGALIGTATTAPYGTNWDSSTVADGAHSLSAKAYGSAGNVRTSAAVLVTTATVPPDATLTSPSQGAFLRGSATLQATASDNQGVAKVEFYDGTTLLGTDTVSPYTLSWNTSTATDGAHSLTAK